MKLPPYILLEVIATSVEDAIEAECGGADRLELVNALEQGGLTPDASLVEEVLGAVTIPVRVMIREKDSMSIGGTDELKRLRSSAGRFSQLPIDGLVAGYIREGALDTDVMSEILSDIGNTPVTFHRAFDEVNDKKRLFEELRMLPLVDRVLTNGGQGSWEERKRQVAQWQRAAGPAITMLFAVGLDTGGLTDIGEVHVGRAARFPKTPSGAVSRVRVAALKEALSCPKRP